MDKPTGLPRFKTIAPAIKPKENEITLPNTGGAFDPETGTGSVETSGGLKWKRRTGNTLVGPKVAVTNLVMTFGPDGRVSATVGNKTVDLATITGGSVTQPSASSVIVGGTVMNLTDAGVKALNKPFADSGTQGKPFKKDKPFGTILSADLLLGPSRLRKRSRGLG